MLDRDDATALYDAQGDMVMTPHHKIPCQPRRDLDLLDHDCSLPEETILEANVALCQFVNLMLFAQLSLHTISARWALLLLAFSQERYPVFFLLISDECKGC